MGFFMVTELDNAIVSTTFMSWGPATSSLCQYDPQHSGLVPINRAEILWGGWWWESSCWRTHQLQHL